MVVVEVSLGCCPGPLTLLGPLGYCPSPLPCLRIAIPFRSTFPPRFLLFLLSLCFDCTSLSIIYLSTGNAKIIIMSINWSIDINRFTKVKAFRRFFWVYLKMRDFFWMKNFCKVYFPKDIKGWSIFSDLIYCFKRTISFFAINIKFILEYNLSNIVGSKYTINTKILFSFYISFRWKIGKVMYYNGRKTQKSRNCMLSWSFRLILYRSIIIDGCFIYDNLKYKVVFILIHRIWTEMKQ